MTPTEIEDHNKFLTRRFNTSLRLDYAHIIYYFLLITTDIILCLH